MDNQTQYLGNWWRFSQYVMDGYSVRPADGATIEKYDVWADYRPVGRKHRGGGLISRPYLDLIEMIDIASPSGTERSQRRLKEGSGSIVEWCNGHGLLGMFFLDVQQVSLYPRWATHPNSNPGQPPMATWRRFIKKATTWIEKYNYAATNVGALTCPPEKRPVDGLVSRELWDKEWDEPGVVLKDPATGVVYTQRIGRAFHDFFPTVPADELETFPYPAPTSDEFWSLYSEEWNQMMRQASSFAKTVRTLGRLPQSPTTAEQEEIRQASEYLQSLASQTNPALHANADGTFVHRWVSSSLIASYAMMALLDIAEGLVNVCENCDKVFVSSAGLAKYCSSRCRKTALQREWRARKEAPATDV